MKPKSLKARALQMERLGIIDPNNRPVVKAGRYGVARIEKELGEISLRATCRLGAEAAAPIVAWADEAKDAIHTEDWLKSKAEIVYAASMGDKEALALHAAAIQITTTNVVRATSVWMPFFEFRDLGPEDSLAFTTETHGMSITVDSIGQDGGRITMQSETEAVSPIHIPIHLRVTPWIEYPLRDLYSGQTKELALAQFDLPRDKAYRQDTMLGSFIMVGEANTRFTDTFTTDGPEALRDYLLHPGVQADTLPAGNLIALGGNSTVSLFRKEFFDEVIAYKNGWGDNALESGSFNPVEIIISSAHMSDWLRQVSFNSQPGFLVDQVFQGGFVMSYGGQTWVITGTNKISKNHGVGYVRFDQPIGIFAEKSSFAVDIVDESAALQAQNKGRTTSQWAESVGLPKHWRKRILAIRFRNSP